MGSSGFGAAALKKIDNGGTRLHYGKNNRFAAIMDDDMPKNNTAQLELPVKTQGNRFAAINEEQSYPDLNNGNETKKETKKQESKPLGRAKTTSELQKEYNALIKADKAAKERKRKEEAKAKELEEAKQNKNKKGKKQKNKAQDKRQSQSQSQQQKKETQTQKQNTETEQEKEAKR